MKVRNFIQFKTRKPQNKYHSETQTVDGISFHSKFEAGYYSQLKIEKRTKLIKDFKRQVAFDLSAAVFEKTSDPLLSVVSGYRKVCVHIVDFLVTLPDGSHEVREVKGFATAEWDLKRKLFEANYPHIPYKVIR